MSPIFALLALLKYKGRDQTALSALLMSVHGWNFVQSGPNSVNFDLGHDNMGHIMILASTMGEDGYQNGRLGFTRVFFEI